ncbi:MAG: hypothetical protein LBB83_05685 [Treponema sp.]|jgi:hypothetical protein|nr:hypothetical protein [Treponema sp.]
MGFLPGFRPVAASGMGARFVKYGGNMGTEQETNENTYFTKGLAQTFCMNYTIKPKKGYALNKEKRPVKRR